MISASVQTREKDQFIWAGFWQDQRKQWTRKIAYSKVKEVMAAAECKASAPPPKAYATPSPSFAWIRESPSIWFRNGWDIPSITTTAIYATATDEEERVIAARLSTTA